MHFAADYGKVSLPDLVSDGRNRPFLIAQVETAVVDPTLWPALSAVDVAFVGTTDLSVTAGTPGELTAVEPLLSKLDSVCRDSGVARGAFVATRGQAEQFASRGYRLLAWGSDVGALTDGVEQRRVALESFNTEDRE